MPMIGPRLGYPRAGGIDGKTMNELEVQVEILSEHVALLEGVLSVPLEEAENGTLQEAAGQIRASLPNIDG